MRFPSLRRHRGILMLLAAYIAVIPVCSAAEDDAERSFTGSAASTVIEAASTALWSAQHLAQHLTTAALDLIGIRYKWGGSTPATGLDCSGLVRFVFQEVTGVTLPRTAKDMSRLGAQIAPSDLQPGDLVFFNTQRFAFSHVGIYLGDNRFVHAPRRGREVEVAALDSAFWYSRFNGARRLAGVLPALIPALVGEAVAAPLTALPAPADDAIPNSRE